MNGHQLAAAIQQATARVAAEGYEHADQRDVMLAGFGYLADAVRGGIYVRLDGKRLFTLGGFLGGLIGGLLGWTL